MKEVYLYACDICSTVKINVRDTGTVWCVMCQACRECQFHYKVTVCRVTTDKDKENKEYTYGFAVEEKKHVDGNKKE